MMDLTEQNLKTINSIHLPNMTVDELVEADSRVESRIHFSEGIWWREVKPFFYQPAAFMMRITPHQAAPKPWQALGGYYHMVPDGAQSNGVIIVNEVPEPASYGLEKLKRKTRYQVRRALAQQKICQITKLDDLINDGYKVYLSWETRMKKVRVKRSNPEVFRRWITRTFHHPYNIILGAYYEGRLISYIIFNAVGGVANLSKTFSDYSFRHIHPSSALIFAYIKICGQNPQIQIACNGLRSHKIPLEQFKAKFGFLHVTYPAYIHLRPFLRPLVHWLMPIQYRRLMGQYDDEIQAQS